jgi:hypothetical protein
MATIGAVGIGSSNDVTLFMINHVTMKAIHPAPMPVAQAATKSALVIF